MIPCARSCFLFLQSSVNIAMTQDAVESAECLHSTSGLLLTAGHHLCPSVLLYSVLTDGVTTAQGSFPRITSLEQPLPNNSEILSCLRCTSLITILTSSIYLEDQALVDSLPYHPSLSMIMAVVLAQPSAEFGGQYGQGQFLRIIWSYPQN